MDSAKSRESLWKSSETVDWIQEWGLAISSLRGQVKLHLQDCVHGWHVDIIIIGVKSDSVTQKVFGRILNTELVVYLAEGSSVQIHAAPSALVVLVDSINEFVHVDDSLFLHHTHQLRLKSVCWVRWHFADGHSSCLDPACFLLLANV